MSDPLPSNPPQEPPLQHLQHSSATARVPDAVGRGVFATAAIVLRGANEIIIDFIQGLGNPRRVAARVILPPAVVSQFVGALDGSIGKYTDTFGAPPRPPVSLSAQQNPPSSNSPGLGSPSAPGSAPSPGSAPPPGSPATPVQTPIAEIYEQLKLPDEMLGGAYANTVAITNSGSEFCFDFIVNFFPRSVVTTRVYMSAAHVTELLASLKRNVAPPR